MTKHLDKLYDSHDNILKLFVYVLNILPKKKNYLYMCYIVNTINIISIAKKCVRTGSQRLLTFDIF